MWITVVVVDHAWWPLGRRPSWTPALGTRDRRTAAFEDYDNTNGVTVTVTANLTDGTFSKPVVAGI